MRTFGTGNTRIFHTTPYKIEGLRGRHFKKSIKRTGSAT